MLAARAQLPPARAACAGSAPTGSTSTCCTGRAACPMPRPSRRSSGCAPTARSPIGASAISIATTWSTGPARMAAVPRPTRSATSLGARGIEWDLLPWCQERGLPIMAYSPLGQGRLLDDPALGGVARRHGVALAATVALAWLLTRQGRGGDPEIQSARTVCAIDRQALDLVLDDADLSGLWTAPFRRRGASSRSPSSDPALNRRSVATVRLSRAAGVCHLWCNRRDSGISQVITSRHFDRDRRGGVVAGTGWKRRFQIWKSVANHDVFLFALWRKDGRAISDIGIVIVAAIIFRFWRGQRRSARRHT